MLIEPVPSPPGARTPVRYLAGFFNGRQTGALRRSLADAGLWSHEMQDYLERIRRNAAARPAAQLDADPQPLACAVGERLQRTEARLRELGLIAPGGEARFVTVRLEALVPAATFVELAAVGAWTPPPDADEELLVEYCTRAHELAAPVQDAAGNLVVFATPYRGAAVPLRPRVRRLGGDFEVVVRVARWPNAVRVRRFHGRYVLVDGHHRAAALLHAGRARIACLIDEARSAGDLALRGRDAFEAEQLELPRPPLLADFFDDDLALEVLEEAKQQLLRLRIETETFVAPRAER